MTISTEKKQHCPGADRLIARRLPIGAEMLPEGGAHFRVWAPLRKKVEVVLEGGAGDGNVGAALELNPEPEGYFSGVVPYAAPGTLYRYRLDAGDLFPDPASRFQPNGPHGPSEVIDPARFGWTDREWGGVSLHGQVLYEMHLGTFTKEGTWKAAMHRLKYLSETGITVVEIMPVADFPGRFGWGYDGVDFFAPTRLYGTTDDFREFVNAAHRMGIGVILDVVYNHQGPDGSYLTEYSDDYFTDRYQTEWGSAFNFDGDNCGPVREFIVSNAGYWIEEFHVDGLRLDATQSIFDNSPQHILKSITGKVRESGQGRSTIVIAENEPQNSKLALPFDQGGCGMDGLWNDDFHHTARVALTGCTEAYYADYTGTPQEFISALKWGFLYQGQCYQWQQKSRGTSSLWLKPETFVVFIQNHDQVANSIRGERIHRLTGPGRYRAMTALMLLAPGTPLLFQGQEFAASSPFLYFADLQPEIAGMVREGRGKFLRQFQSIDDPLAAAELADPSSSESFEQSKLDFSEQERHAEAYALHRDLLHLRRSDPVFSAQTARALDGAVLGPEAFVLRYFQAGGDDRLLLVNFGRDIRLTSAPEPLLAPPEEREWKIFWSSEDPRYGGGGTPSLINGESWRIHGASAMVFTSEAVTPGYEMKCK